MSALESTVRRLDAAPGASTVDRSIERAIANLIARQRQDGHWVFELEADATIPAEYVLLTHFLGEPEPARETRIAAYLRRIQGEHGGWPLYMGGPFNISASVKAYFALKMIGDAPDAPHMQRARNAILAHGGAGRTNVFTRYLLALFGVLPWSNAPTLPVEIMLLPRWFPFNVWRISYWSRTVVVPLLVLQLLKPRARNPRGIDIAELFPANRPRGRRWARAPHQSRLHFACFAAVDGLLQLYDALCPRALRRHAVNLAVRFVTERLNGEHGLGAIFPAMANTVMMFDALGYSRDDPEYVIARRSIDRLLVMHSDEAYCQPCVSPVWDTVLASHALLETGQPRAIEAARRGLGWLKDRQVLDTWGDWAIQRPGVRPGGWAFQYGNAYYPDLDDTAAVVMALDRYAREHDAFGAEGFRNAIERGREWVLGLQSRNGGWGAFDADNTSEYLNHIPFADHGALLDPPTSDVTARCAGMLAQLGEAADQPALRSALQFLRDEQERDGSWYGRWGMNYIYGTWSVLCAFHIAGVDAQSPEVRRAVAWLVSIQNADGGWGESGASYELDHRGHESAPSTPSQTAWALLALMAAGEVGHAAVARGIEYLAARQDGNGAWPEPEFTATGFPRVFFLRYHGYAKFFPLWALARYRTMLAALKAPARFGM
ncbi:MAG TPA: squalene--hopene cyclase [Casimicrobiaceae bacterium]|nr:squalene--hopene cyclase [Casimicrobiaceae bacterium]